MDFNPGKYYNILESLVSIFTIDQGQVKVLLLRKKSEPYRGYWILPGGIVSNDETIEMNIIDSIEVKLGLKDVYLEQCHIFSNLDRDPDDRIIAISYIGLIDNVSALFKREDRDDIQTAWFKINDVPKMAYDHARILKKNIEFLRRKIVNSNVLKSLFPSDFTLPELQKAYEQILNVTMDRRNFRKKFITLGLIEDTGDKNVGGNGRPAKLYSFKEEIKERNLF
ncbi:MAG: NUDIX hydrolase [Bacilli bacterium]|nr:NUDIX hydrolase [Bacilli bacterium]